VGKVLGSILRASILKTLCAFVLICNANDLFSQASETYNWGVTYGHKIFNEFPEADGLNTLSVLFLNEPTFIFDEAALDVDLSGFRFSVGLVLNPD